MALVVDTGPLYASIDRADAAHEVCRRLLLETPERVVIPAPVLVEVDQLLLTRRATGTGFQLLLDAVVARNIDVVDLEVDDYRRVRELIEQYADLRVGFVDAAVLAIVERLGEPKLATLDRRHFGVMRPRHVEALQLLPA